MIQKQLSCFNPKALVNIASSFLVVLAAVLLILPLPALAAPYGGKVSSGNAVILQSGSSTNINQQSHKAAINWQGFSIGSGETVNFNQPSASSMTLNRVVGSEKSLINGALNANGRVFLLNSNGVLIGKGASVNTGGLVASALDISDEDFKNENFVFQAAGPGGEVINRGKITVPEGGYAVLLGGKVINEGVILAQKGTVSLNGAQRAVLNFNGDSLVSVSLDEGAVAALVENKGAVYADGGQIIMTAKAADYLADSQINTEGLLQAHTLGELSGRILIYAYGGTANVRGTLDASAPNGGNGGFIETSGDKVKIADSARVTTLAPKGKYGRWLIDPTDFTVAASGGDITGSSLSLQLAGSPIEIQSAKGSKNGSGDIYILDGISWTADTVLTLTADRNINIYAPIAASGDSAGLVLNYGIGVNGGDYYIRTKASFSGVDVVEPLPGVPGAGLSTPKIDTSGGVYGSVTLSGTQASLNINNSPYILLYSVTDIKTKLDDTNKKFALATDIDASSYTGTSVFNNRFVGVLAGLGHEIQGLAMEGTGGIGLIKTLGNNNSISIIRDLGFFNSKITATGSSFSGILASNAYSVDVSNVYSFKSQISATTVGGLFGSIEQNATANILNVFIKEALITSTNGLKAGGILGEVWKSTANISSSQVVASTIQSNERAGGFAGDFIGYIDKSWSDVTIISGRNAGGFVATSVLSNNFVNISNSFSKGSITIVGSGTSQYFGGLIGQTVLSEVFNSYSTMNIIFEKSASYVGGLIGYLTGGAPDPNFKISNVHFSGEFIYNVSPALVSLIGGLAGQVQSPVIFDLAYSSADVKGINYVGGLFGYGISVSVTNSYMTGDVYGGFGGQAGGYGGIFGYYQGSSFSEDPIMQNIYFGGAMITDSLWHAGALIGGKGTSGQGYNLNIIVSNVYWDLDKNSDLPAVYFYNVGETDTYGVSNAGNFQSDIINSIITGTDPQSAVDSRVAAANNAAIREQNEAMTEANTAAIALSEERSNIETAALNEAAFMDSMLNSVQDVGVISDSSLDQPLIMPVNTALSETQSSPLSSNTADLSQGLNTFASELITSFAANIDIVGSDGSNFRTTSNSPSPAAADSREDSGNSPE